MSSGLKRAVVLQHVAMEGPGRIADLCRERGLEVVIHEVHAGARVPRVVNPDEVLIVMGGGMGVGDRDEPAYPFLRDELGLLAGSLRDGRAILGICLGAQLLAYAAGARVYAATRVGKEGVSVRVREVGWGDVTLLGADTDPTLAGLGQQMKVLHWHGDTFELPAGAVRLASTTLCENQAFRIGTRVFGLQFHAECDAETARRWAVEDADFVRAARGPEGPEMVIAETERFAAAARAAGDQMIRNILGCMAG
ncbi:MAG: glutamine amidotransferase [Pseudomonadota bacterium]